MKTTPSPKNLRDAVPALRGIVNFQISNAAALQITLGPPVVLLAKYWGASATYIGLITSLMPLLAALQFIFAPRIEYFGFRRTMVAGWTARNIILTVMATLPWVAIICAPHDYGLLRGLLFMFVFLYAMARGLVSASWMPWIAHLVPRDWRGRYVSLEQLCVNLSTGAAYLVSGMILGVAATNARYGIVFAIALFSAMWSLYFLKRIDAPPPREGRATPESPLSWIPRAWRDRPLRRLIRVNVIVMFGTAAWSSFTIVFLKDRFHIDERMILYMQASQTFGNVLSGLMWGRLNDRFGARPIMSLSTRLILATLALWLLVAMSLIPAAPWLLYAISVAYGMGVMGFTVVTMSYLLNNAPPQAPVLALTLYAVTNSLATAIAPALWGPVLDAMVHLRFTSRLVTFDRFAFFYAVSLVFVIAGKAMIHRVPERVFSAPRVVLYHVFADYPVRALGLVYRLLSGER